MFFDFSHYIVFTPTGWRYSIEHCLGCAEKKSAGSSVRDPLQQGTFFECQSDVDAFVAKYPSRHLLESQVHCIVYSSVVMEWGVLVVIVHCSGV